MPTKAKNGKALLIVESPSKVKTISGYLGGEFLVDSSMGHIRDLPQPSELPENLKKARSASSRSISTTILTPTMWSTPTRRKSRRTQTQTQRR